MLWGARLAGFLLFRIIKTGKDDRFDDKRGKVLPMLGFYVFQTLWVWTVSMPVTVLNSPIVNRYPQPAFNKATDIIGIIGFVIGITMEAVSDIQKYRFKQTHKERGAVCNKGFFAWSRHPNYFGEILIQFSIFMIAVTPASYDYVRGGAKSALFASIVGPIFLTTLLMFVSGLTLQE
ncbi:oxidoreductase-like protein, partial [Aureobasidium sp. EXF-8845]